MKRSRKRSCTPSWICSPNRYITFIRFLEKANPRLAKEAFFHILMDFGWIDYEEIMILNPAWRKRRRRREGKV